MNIWNNVVRWELRTRLFLRTTEFLWQEAHTFHATQAEAEEEVATGLEGYRQVSEDWLAIPVIKGRKTDGEKFPGADFTWCIEAMMRDKKALQAGTSHMLGQNFARAADIEFLDTDNVRKHPYGTSWGFSTRMVGATIMTHGDDSGLVLPPNVAPVQVVIVPIFRKDEEKALVAEAIDRFQATLAETPEGKAVRVKVDWRDDSPGFKYNHWELRGVPFRLEIGPRDVAAGQGMLVKRVDRSKEPVPLMQLAAELPARLRTYQAELLQRARDFQAENTHHVDTYQQLKDGLDADGGFFLAPWCGDGKCEKQVNDETGATIRCIPFDSPDESGKCIACGGPSPRRVIFAKAY
jgi:prolyl-tRNA synthetase